MRLLVSIVVAALSGFIALSYEILWVRLYSFLTEGPASAFGFLLGAYLAGLALGAFAARWFCRRAGSEAGEAALRTVGLFLLAANLVGFLAIPAIAEGAIRWSAPERWSLAVFGGVAALIGTGFPLIAHFGIPADARTGARLSYLYVGNIVGSASGSLTTGLVLFDLLGLRQIAVLLALAGLAVSGLLVLATTPGASRKAAIAAGLVGAGALCVAVSPRLYDRIYEKLQYKLEFKSDTRFVRVYEGKSGVIAVSKSDNVYGGGSYDGCYNIDPTPGEDPNRVVRAYLVPAFHPAPREVLMIGLGSGSWLQVMANDPDVERITAVEINSGYVEMMSHYPVVASAVKNPKVEIVVDDGLRYMRRVDRHYDLIVQNTIVFWKAHATSLLSREYLELTRTHLKPGGIVYYNTTSSTASQRTGATVFPFAWRFQNMLIASDRPIEIDRDRWRRKMAAWTIDGQPAVDWTLYGAILEKSVFEDPWRRRPTWEDRASILERTRLDPVITDDNMVTEWAEHDVYPEPPW